MLLSAYNFLFCNDDQQILDYMENSNVFKDTFIDINKIGLGARVVYMYRVMYREGIRGLYTGRVRSPRSVDQVSEQNVW